MGEELGQLPAMQRVADISMRADDASRADVNYLLGLLDVLLYPEEHHWSVSREYLRMSAVLVGSYGAQAHQIDFKLRVSPDRPDLPGPYGLIGDLDTK